MFLCDLVIFNPILFQKLCFVPPELVLHWRVSTIYDYLPLKVVFHQRSSSSNSCLPSIVIFHQRTASIKGRLLSKAGTHPRPSSIEGHLPSMVTFHQRMSSILLFKVQINVWYIYCHPSSNHIWMFGWGGGHFMSLLYYMFQSILNTFVLDSFLLRIFEYLNTFEP